jgi:hypothetical protein
MNFSEKQAAYIDTSVTLHLLAQPKRQDGLNVTALDEAVLSK